MRVRALILLLCTISLCYKGSESAFTVNVVASTKWKGRMGTCNHCKYLVLRNQRSSNEGESNLKHPIGSDITSLPFYRSSLRRRRKALLPREQYMFPTKKDDTPTGVVKNDEISYQPRSSDKGKVDSTTNSTDTVTTLRSPYEISTLHKRRKPQFPRSAYSLLKDEQDLKHTFISFVDQSIFSGYTQAVRLVEPRLYARPDQFRKKNLKKPPEILDVAEPPSCEQIAAFHFLTTDPLLYLFYLENMYLTRVFLLHAYSVDSLQSTGNILCLEWASSADGCRGFIIYCVPLHY